MAGGDTYYVDTLSRNELTGQETYSLMKIKNEDAPRLAEIDKKLKQLHKEKLQLAETGEVGDFGKRVDKMDKGLLNIQKKMDPLHNEKNLMLPSMPSLYLMGQKGALNWGQVLNKTEVDLLIKEGALHHLSYGRDIFAPHGN